MRVISDMGTMVSWYCRQNACRNEHENAFIWIEKYNWLLQGDKRELWKVKDAELCNKQSFYGLNSIKANLIFRSLRPCGCKTNVPIECRQDINED